MIPRVEPFWTVQPQLSSNFEIGSDVWVVCAKNPTLPYRMMPADPWLQKTAYPFE